MENKRIRYLIITILVLAISMNNAFAGDLKNFEKVKEYPNKFSDISISDWYFNDVVNAYESGLFAGRTETEFAPNKYLTLAEAITLTSRVHHIFNNNGQIEGGEYEKWYTKYVNYSIRNGLFIPGEFDTYDRYATRAEIAYLFVNSIGKDELQKNNDITEINDVSNEMRYAKEIYILYTAGVIAGSDKYGSFNPTTAIKRAEVAAVLNRVINKDSRLKVSFEEKPDILPINENLTLEQKQAVEDIKVALGKDTYDYKAFVYANLKIGQLAHRKLGQYQYN